MRDAALMRHSWFLDPAIRPVASGVDRERNRHGQPNLFDPDQQAPG